MEEIGIRELICSNALSDFIFDQVYSKYNVDPKLILSNCNVVGTSIGAKAKTSHSRLREPGSFAAVSDLVRVCFTLNCSSSLCCTNEYLAKYSGVTDICVLISVY